MPWVNIWVAYFLVVQWATATIEDGKPEESDPSDYDEIVTTKKAKTIDAFSFQVIHMNTKTVHRGEGINMMTQGLHVEDGSLPQGLTVQSAYMEICNGSKNVTVVVRNSTAVPKPWERRPQSQEQLQLHGYLRSLCRGVWQRCQKRTMAVRHPS